MKLEKLPSIKVGPTALAWPMTLTLNLLQIMVMHKFQGQRSVSSKDRVETNRRMADRGDCITSHANAVGNYWNERVVNCWLQLLSWSS